MTDEEFRSKMRTLDDDDPPGPPPAVSGQPRKEKRPMVNSVYAVLMFLAFLCLVLAALGVSSRFNLGWLGMALWLLGALSRG